MLFWTAVRLSPFCFCKVDLQGGTRGTNQKLLKYQDTSFQDSQMKDQWSWALIYYHTWSSSVWYVINMTMTLNVWLSRQRNKTISLILLEKRANIAAISDIWTIQTNIKQFYVWILLRNYHYILHFWCANNST